VLTGTAAAALGHVTLEHLADESLALHVVNAYTRDASGVLATGLAAILALLAHNLGTNRAGNGDVTMNVLDIHGGALGVLVVLGLGGVLDALLRLDDVLASGRLVNDAALGVHEVRGLGRRGHFVLSIVKLITLNTSSVYHMFCM